MNLKSMRERIGLSQKELSDKADVKKRSIQDYEQGQLSLAKANGRTLYKLSKALGCSMEELIEEEILADEDKGVHKQ